MVLVRHEQTENYLSANNKSIKPCASVKTRILFRVNCIAPVRKEYSSMCIDVVGQNETKEIC